MLETRPDLDRRVVVVAAVVVAAAAVASMACASPVQARSCTDDPDFGGADYRNMIQYCRSAWLVPIAAVQSESLFVVADSFRDH